MEFACHGENGILAPSALVHDRGAAKLLLMFPPCAQNCTDAGGGDTPGWSSWMASCLTPKTGPYKCPAGGLDRPVGYRGLQHFALCPVLLGTSRCAQGEGFFFFNLLLPSPDITTFKGSFHTQAILRRDLVPQPAGVD